MGIDTFPGTNVADLFGIWHNKKKTSHLSCEESAIIPTDHCPTVGALWLAAERETAQKEAHKYDMEMQSSLMKTL